MADPSSTDRTVLSHTTDGFGRPQCGLSLMGVLTPINKKSMIPPTRIDQAELVIGRGEAGDGIDLNLADDNVSRRHARICRIDNHYRLEDLNSSNGTYVDGVPIRSTELHDGDTIQIGRSLVSFDCLVEFADQPADDTKRLTLREWHALRKEVNNKDQMSLQFWGTRGSLPTPGAETRKYGGNTTCVELRWKDTIIVLDAGSGIRELSTSWSQEFTEGPIDASLCFTHLHWDHIQGFPFFGAAYAPSNRFQVYGAHREAGSTKDLLSDTMKGDYFPIPMSAMQAKMDFHDTTKKFDIGGIDIETFDLPHPSGSLGYRFSAGDNVFVMATDSELDQVALNPDELKDDFLAPRKYDPAFLEPFRGADLLLIDSQYSDEEYLTKVGWGHNSIAAIVDLCRQVRPKMVALSHHDPMSNDERVCSYVKEAADRLHASNIQDVLVFGARENLVVSVASPKAPAKVE